MLQDKINLAEKLARFSDHWAPRTVAQLNEYDIMVVKVQGEFVWHAHADTDDFFLVLSGRLTIRLRDREVVLEPGELFVVPRGDDILVDHRESRLDVETGCRDGQAVAQPELLVCLFRQSAVISA